MKSFDNYVNETFEMLSERSINKINKEFTEVVNKMAEKATEYKEAEGAAKEAILVELKELNAKKKELTKELDKAVAGKDRNVELAITEAKLAGLSKEETLKVAQKFADAIAEVDGVKVTVSKDYEEDSFDLDYDGDEYAGGSYIINADGSVVNIAVRTRPIVGTKDDDVKTIVKFMKKHYGKLAKESVVTEAKNTIGLAFKDEDDYNGFVEFIKDEKGSIKKDFGWDSKTKSWEVIMDVKVLDSIYGEGTPGNKESGWYGALPGDFESVIIESVVTEGKTITKAAIEEVGDSRNSEGYSSNEYYILADFVDGEITMKDLAKLVKSGAVQKELKGEAEIDMEYLEEFSESVVTEGRVTLKRRYTENHPAVTVSKNAKVRNKVLEFIKDGRITQEAFEKFVADLSNNSKRWTKNNSRYFTISEEGVSLSKMGKKLLAGITVNEATTSNPGVWVPGEFDKELNKLPNSKITLELVSKLAKKYKIDLEDAIKYVEYGWAMDLNENKTSMKTKFIYESFGDFVNSLNKSTETLNEAFASTKLASILTGGNKMDKDLPKAFYNMSKIALDKIQDVDIIEMDPATAKKEKRANAIYMYFTTNAKENPYAGRSAWSGEKEIPANTLLAITNGQNEWMATEWQRSYSNKQKPKRTLKVGKREDAAGFKKSGKGEYNSGISSMKQVSELADRAYVLDLDILRARYSTVAKRDERTAARKGAVAFQDDKEFKAENLSRYNTIIADRAAKMPIDKMVAGAIDTISKQIKDGLAKGEKGRYGEIVVGRNKKGREGKLSDAARHMQNILDEFQRYVNDTNQAEVEKNAGYAGDYYAGRVKKSAKEITDKIKQIDNFGYVW